jgi:hypothetical protein
LAAFGVVAALGAPGVAHLRHGRSAGQLVVRDSHFVIEVVLHMAFQSE